MVGLNGEIKRAVEWAAEQFLQDPTASVSSLMEHASQRFRLSPAEREFLRRLLEGGPWH